MELCRKRGFTLIELLIVVAIIGVLATLVIINLSGANVRARNTQRASDMKSVQTALGLYHEENKAYPDIPEAQHMRSECNGWGVIGAGGFAANEVIPGLIPTFLPVLPRDSKMSTEQTVVGGYQAADSDKYCYIYASYNGGRDYAFILHYTNTAIEASEIDWLSMPNLVDPMRAESGGSTDDPTPFHYTQAVCNSMNWVMPSSNARIHAWKIYSSGGRCY